MADESTISDTLLNQQEEELLREALELAEEELRKEEQALNEAYDSLAGSITRKYKDRAARRGSKEQEWLTASSLILNSLAVNSYNTNPDRPFESRNTKYRPDRNIVSTKCDLAISQIISSQFAGGEKNWDALPPDILPPEIPDIIERCESMEHTIANQLEECDYMTEAYKAITQWVQLGTGIIKGPVNYGKMKKTYVPQMGADGQRVWVPQVTTEYKPYLSWVDVWKFYGDDTTNIINNGEDTIEVHPMSTLELQKLADNPGFMPEVIYEFLKIGPDDSPSDSYANSTSVSASTNSMYKNKFQVLEYHGPVSRDQLNKLDIVPSYDMPGDVYFGEVWVLNNKIIRIELENIEGCHKPPYSGVVWKEDPASPYGFGVPIILKDHQRVTSESWHMMLDNASASSGPQIIINQDLVEPADGSYELAPGKIWYTTDVGGTKVGDVFSQFEIVNTTPYIINILDRAVAAAEEESGIPAMLAGLESPQVTTDNATGMAIEEDRSTTLLDFKSSQWDRYITGPRFEAMYDWNMQFNSDDTIKAPMTLRIRPATEYRNKQKHIRDMEKLIVQAAQNPIMSEYLNIGELVRAQLGMMTLPTRSIVKSSEQVQREQEEKAKNPPPPSPEEMKFQEAMTRLELEKEKLALEREKLQFEVGLNQRREEMENEERLANTYARVAEAEGQVVKSQNEKEIALLTLAAKSEIEAKRERLTAGIALQNDATNRYLKGLDHTAKARDQLIKQDENDIYREEMQLKREKGSGI